MPPAPDPSPWLSGSLQGGLRGWLDSGWLVCLARRTGTAWCFWEEGCGVPGPMHRHGSEPLRRRWRQPSLLLLPAGFHERGENLVVTSLEEGKFGPCLSA